MSSELHRLAILFSKSKRLPYAKPDDDWSSLTLADPICHIELLAYTLTNDRPEPPIRISVPLFPYDAFYKKRTRAIGLLRLLHISYFHKIARNGSVSK